MQYLIFSIFTLALIGVFLRNKKTFLNVVLKFGAIPFTLFMPTMVVGGVNGQAALLLVLFLLLLTASVVGLQKLLLVSTKVYLLFIFIVLSCISVLWTHSIVECLGMTIKYATPVLFVVLILSVMRSYKDILKCEKSIVICGIILIVFGVLNKLLGEPFDTANKWKGSLVLVAPYMSPANYSFMLAMCALLAFANFLHTKKKSWFILFIVFYVGVMFAFTRISMVALLFSSMILYGVSKKSLLISYVAPIVAAIVAASSVIFIKPLRDRMFFQNVDLSLVFTNFNQFLSYVNTSGRTTLWEGAFEYFKNESIFIGAGSGSVDFWVKLHTGALALHCDFLRIYFDLGLIGLTLFLVGHFQLIVVACKTPNNSSNEIIHHKYKSLSIGAFVFYFITLFTDNTLNYVADIGMYLYSFIGFTLFLSLSKKSLSFAGNKLNSRAKNEGFSSLENKVENNSLRMRMHK